MGRRALTLFSTLVVLASCSGKGKRERGAAIEREHEREHEHEHEHEHENENENERVAAEPLRVYSDADIITSSLVDRHGRLWFGTTTEGLYRFDGEAFTNVTAADGLCSDQVWSIVEDPSGVLWLGTERGLCTFDDGRFGHIPLPHVDTSSEWFKGVYPTVNPNQASVLIQDRDAMIWVGSAGGGAYRFDGRRFESVLSSGGVEYEDGLHHNVIQDLLEDREGNIWFASMSNGGVTRYDGVSFRTFTSEDGLSDSMVRCLYEDRQGGVWVGTNGNRRGGLDRIDDDGITNYDESDGLCSANIAAMLQSRDGRLWLGSDRGGVCSYQDGAFERLEELSEVSVRTIVEDRSGGLWFGGRRGNLWRLEGQRLTDFTQTKNMSGGAPPG